MISAEPGTLLIYADIVCPWATLAIVRLWDARRRLALEDAVRFDLRCFPLELFNNRPTPRRVHDAEIPVVAQLAPEFGWQIWQRRVDEYPVTTLLPLEAVQAAKEQGLAASEKLDLALRRSFFADSRCISLRSEVLVAAKQCDALDVDALSAALDDGRARGRVVEQWRSAERHDVQGSPHVFAPDGSSVPNPGVTIRWVGGGGRGFPVIEEDDPAVLDELLTKAAV